MVQTQKDRAVLWPDFHVQFFNNTTSCMQCALSLGGPRQQKTAVEHITRFGGVVGHQGTGNYTHVIFYFLKPSCLRS